MYGKEVGKCGTPYLQGFFTLKVKLSMTGVHKALGTKSIALPLSANGTSYQASAYCKKGEQPKEEWESLKDSGPNYGLNFDGEEFGACPTPGKRTDLDAPCEAVEEGKSLLEVSKIHPASYVRNYRGLANLQALNTSPYEHTSVRGIYYWGPPGQVSRTRPAIFVQIHYTLNRKVNGGTAILVNHTSSWMTWMETF